MTGICLRSLLTFSICVVAISVVLVGGLTAQKKSLNFVPDEVLVKFKSGGSAGAKKTSIGRFNASIAEDLGNDGWTRLKLKKGQGVDDAIKSFRSVEEIESVQPNYYYYLQSAPDDALWGNLYGMVKISAPAAWDIRTDCSSVVVADIDTGLDYTHEDLAANSWTNPDEVAGNGIDDDGNGFIDDVHGYDFRYNDPDPMDEHGHGTHTAGTIGAIGNNAIGVAGVCWNVKIMGIKIYSEAANDTTSAMLINAYNYVTLMKTRGVNIRVTNNSYGGCPETCGDDPALRNALDAMGDAGILNVFAAGNSGTNNDVAPFFPASYDSPHIVSVGGSDQLDERIFNYGAKSVDLAAPAYQIWSTIPMYNPNHYAHLSGTSMSAPHVAGAAALLAAQYPSLSAASIKATLINTADTLPAFAGLNRANGRLNVAAALQNPTVCTFSLASRSLRPPTKGGVFTLDVAAGQNCDFAAKSSANWLQLFDSQSFTGGSTVVFRVTLNPVVARTATLTIAGQDFSVTQSRR